MNAKKTASVIFFLMLICVSLVFSTSAQTSVTTGVSQGDSFKYDVRYIWRSTNPADVVPLSWINNNQTDYLQVTVDAASGTSLRLSSVWHYLNGTQSIPTISIVEVGNSTVNGFDFFYAANLTQGSNLFPLITDMPFRINGTEFRSFDEANNYRAINYIIVNRTDLPNHVYSMNELYFDQKTGVLVEDTITEVFTATPAQTYITQITLVESSLWDISQISTPEPTASTPATIAPGQTSIPTSTQGNGETPTAESFDMLLIVLVVILVVIVIVIIFILLTRRPKTARKPSVPSTITETRTSSTVAAASVTPGMVKCKHCGTENPEANEFCGKCGKRLRK